MLDWLKGISIGGIRNWELGIGLSIGYLNEFANILNSVFETGGLV